MSIDSLKKKCFFWNAHKTEKNDWNYQRGRIERNSRLGSNDLIESILISWPILDHLPLSCDDSIIHILVHKTLSGHDHDHFQLWIDAWSCSLAEYRRTNVIVGTILNKKQAYKSIFNSLKCFKGLNNSTLTFKYFN